MREDVPDHVLQIYGRWESQTSMLDHGHPHNDDNTVERAFDSVTFVHASRAAGFNRVDGNAGLANKEGDRCGVVEFPFTP